MWRPNKTQAREFAKKMQEDAEFKAEYLARKEAKAQKRRDGSVYDYETAGGSYIPTRQQHDAAYKMLEIVDNQDLEMAANSVIMGYMSQVKIDHDDIHVVNEFVRKNMYVI